MNTQISKQDRIDGGIIGALVGDALGVPREFEPRESLRERPCVEMEEFGSHMQPRGTWSDDGSLLLCSADALCGPDFDPEMMAANFSDWRNNGMWAAHGKVFDIGGATSGAISRYDRGVPPLECGGTHDSCNGNGSIMRILPVALRFADKDPDDLMKIAADASAITHGHEVSKLACGLYCLIAVELLRGSDDPLQAMTDAWGKFLANAPQGDAFNRIKKAMSVITGDEVQIGSSGYVLDSLQAAVWCLLKTDNYRDCVLKAVNLGQDTDTTACVAGGLAGIHYGISGIPAIWVAELPKQNAIDGLLNRFYIACLPADATAQIAADETAPAPVPMTVGTTIAASGKFIEIVRHESGWEYVRRTKASGVVAIVAITDDAEILLVEQKRIPVGGRPVIELPAGLVGDHGGAEAEADAAARELEEETGYKAGWMGLLALNIPASAGLTSETTNIYLATALKQVGQGGGLASEGENITVHKVRLEEVVVWLRRRMEAGCLVDPRVYAGIAIMNQAFPFGAQKHVIGAAKAEDPKAPCPHKNTTHWDASGETVCNDCGALISA